jgi:uncharacterized protein (TIGR02001 family)
MLKKKLLVVALASAFSLPALASDHTVTANVGFVTDYIYRGIAQTSHKPALQGGVDYSHASGFYAGLWGSNVSWIKDSAALVSGDKTIELDTYLGYKGTAAEVSYDIGAVRYNYLGDGKADTANAFTSADTAELYGAATYKWFTAKYSYSLLDGFLTFPGTKGTSYFDISGSYTLEDTGVILGAHVGKQDIKNNPLWSYTDYKLSASKDFSGYVVGAALTGTNVTSKWTMPTGGNWGKTVVALSVLRSF